MFLKKIIDQKITLKNFLSGKTYPDKKASFGFCVRKAFNEKAFVDNHLKNPLAELDCRTVGVSNVLLSVIKDYCLFLEKQDEAGSYPRAIILDDYGSRYVKYFLEEQYLKNIKILVVDENDLSN